MGAYEDVLYDDYAFVEAHPARLRALGTLFGMRLPDAPLRVLDVGCGLGGHLIPLAEQDPDGTYVGIDLSAPQIQRGQATIQALGLTNVELRVADLRELPAELGRFDVIVCHGVYSWVPTDARVAIWSLLGRHLLPHGIGYVSYNVYPGWRHRGTVRDVLARLVPGPDQADDRERIQAAREVLDAWAGALQDRGAHRLAALAEELKLLGQTSDAYLLYEHLAPINEPQWLGDVLTAAQAFGLQYLGDADLGSMFPDLSESTRAWVSARAPTVEAAEQVNDLLVHRLFRRSLFVRDTVVLDRELHWRRLESLSLAARLTAHEEREHVWINTHGTEVDVEDAELAAAVRHLVQADPGACTFDQVIHAVLGPDAPTRERAALGRGLLQLASRSMIELRTHFPAISSQVPERPSALPLARLQAERGEDGAVNLRHERVRLGKTDRAVLRRLDGTRTRHDLIQDLRRDATDGPVEVRIDGELRTDADALGQAVDLVLDRLRRAAFLQGPA